MAGKIGMKWSKNKKRDNKPYTFKIYNDLINPFKVACVSQNIKYSKKLNELIEAWLIEEGRL